MDMIIDGKSRQALDHAVIRVENPATGESIDTVPAAGAKDLRCALEAAVRGKALWKRTPVRERSDILRKAADLMEAEKEALGDLLARETGKIRSEAVWEVVCARELFLGYSGKILHHYGAVLPSESDVILTQSEPLGVVACITPFNFPIEMYAHKVAPALAAGNAVVVKPASVTPLSGIYITDLLHRAGVPGEVLQVVTGSGAMVGRGISESPLVDAISVTGSTEAGIDIRQRSAKHLVRTFLELGGNDAMIVFEDTDLEKAMDGIIAYRTYCGGQVCIAAKRMLVQNTIMERFVQLLKERLEHFPVGDPFDVDNKMGSMASRDAALEIEAQVAHTVAQGAACVLGGRHFGNAFFPPTILAGVTKEMDVAKDLEIFGPVFSIIGFDTEEEALEIANQSSYGLAGTVYSADLFRAYRVANSMEAGSVAINPPYVYRTFDMPFGGHKMSGIGNEGLFNTLEEMTKHKTISITGMKR